MFYLKGINPNSLPVRNKKKNHTHKTIFTWFGKFAYVYGVARISLLLGKNTKCSYKFAYWPKPPLHGLSLSKSPIKNHATLFGSNRVVKPDQAKLGSTKSNKSPTWRLVQSPTSTAILQNTIPHPYNSSFCP